MFKTTSISRAYESTTQTVYKAPGRGMARGELRSTLSRAGPCRCSALTHQSPEIGKEKNKFSFSLGFHYICREWRFL